ncbi:unnamed protein product [Hymenolepis diminuta]|uniref:Uncharacterized protein n=1 Tax=Hymenolepis diminuta TaxID=6216 RepID=A0A564YAZ9_HYMDI|nr:unnamed protein product [Hymenolepis diminuta]
MAQAPPLVAYLHSRSHACPCPIDSYKLSLYFYSHRLCLPARTLSTHLFHPSSLLSSLEASPWFIQYTLTYTTLYALLFGTAVVADSYSVSVKICSSL